MAAASRGQWSLISQWRPAALFGPTSATWRLSGADKRSLAYKVRYAVQRKECWQSLRFQRGFSETATQDADPGGAEVPVDWLRKILEKSSHPVHEMPREETEAWLLHRPLEENSALVLLESLAERAIEGVSTAKVLEGAAEGLRYAKERSETLASSDLAFSKHVGALEGLAAIRRRSESGGMEAAIAELTGLLLDRLRGAPGICRLVVLSRSSDLGIRALAALWWLPEAEGTSGGTGIAAWLCQLSAVRWARELRSPTTEESVATAACYLARCGAWRAARGRFPLIQALKRNHHAVTHEDPVQEPMSADAGAFWLLALAQAGEDLQELRFWDTLCKDALLQCIPAGKSVPGVAVESDEETQPGQSIPNLSELSPASSARILWALAAAGKLDEALYPEGPTWGAALMERLAGDKQPESFSLETWSLLAELQLTLAPAAAEAEEQSESSEAGETEAGDEEATASPPSEDSSGFATKLWQTHVEAVLSQQREWLLASKQYEEFRKELDALEDLGEGEERGEVTYDSKIGQYTVAAMVESRNVAIDFDVWETPVNRALRRQQWAAVAPDTRVAEITMAQWDGRDREGKVALLRRRLLDLPDDAPAGDDDDE